MRVVVDTNVLIVSNSRETHASAADAARCSEQLLDIQSNHTLLDDLELGIFGEYSRYCNFSGQPGPGDIFFAWYVQVRGTSGHVESVAIGDDIDIQAILPTALSGMDPSDKKFVAVYLEGKGEVLFNAADSDWSQMSAELRSAGVHVEELCPHLIKR